MEQQSNGQEQKTKKSWFEKDLALNLSFRESGIRAIVGIVLLFIMVPIDPLLIFYALPVTVYLYITALSHFCPIKYFWNRIYQHKKGHQTFDWPADQSSQIDPSLEPVLRVVR